MVATVWLLRCLKVMVVVVPVFAAQGDGAAAAGVAGLVRAITKEVLSDCHLAVVGYGQTVIQGILRGLDSGATPVLPRTVVDVAEKWQGRHGLLRGVVRGDVRDACRLLVAQGAGSGKEEVFQ
ncbi:uncharacterized protein LOC126997760 [Eriocheir sinensis]|uniref:uncharacterized protein LOC126997760 n=1 Tax=Eriocheir sinensis TaxID=95602 RepID=UPI0021C99A22|nr:uncharacterized protein LOC126997760 [Eriocheir sinensis]